MKTIDLNLAQELQSVCKEKNVTMPESYFCYFESMQTHAVKIGIAKSKMFPIAPAFTLDELLEILPRVIQKNGNFYEQTLQFSRTLNTYRANYDCEYDDIVLLLTDSCWHPNPANACAKLLIWLIKEGLI